jgi:hypothetical protein
LTVPVSPWAVGAEALPPAVRLLPARRVVRVQLPGQLVLARMVGVGDDVVVEHVGEQRGVEQQLPRVSVAQASQRSGW